MPLLKVQIADYHCKGQARQSEYFVCLIKPRNTNSLVGSSCFHLYEIRNATCKVHVEPVIVRPCAYHFCHGLGVANVLDLHRHAY